MTATPAPKESTPSPLSGAAKERVKALITAKDLLAERTPLTTSAVEVLPLIRLADYILTGTDYVDRPKP